ncbi:MAG: ABC transporter substrate-binding protein [Acidimicrobiaceae bacterium]|jgi:sulfonate transport system substrate-binding protein|nr:ABC transporter substrate-binding protein [Acidimicrobiaceae bacterium]
MRVLRVGGVHEPFNLPWLRAFEDNAFAHLGVEVTFANFAGGTGALVGALEDWTIDLATVLTEGGVTAIGRGSKIRLHSAFVTSPLRWGIHVAAKATQKKVAELEGKKFAISRFGSGSELMAYELADQQGWKLKDKQFVVVGGVDGAVEVLPKRKAHIFLWERFVTAPLVKQGVFKRIGEIPTPWPSFYTAARPELLDRDRQLVDNVVDIMFGYAADLVANPESTIDLIVDRYGMGRRDARTWLAGVEWPSSRLVDSGVLDSVVARMVELGRIEETIPAADLL